MIPTISLQKAKTQKLKRYFDGNSCSKGHISEKYVSTRCCVQCASNRARDLSSAPKSSFTSVDFERIKLIDDNEKELKMYLLERFGICVESTKTARGSGKLDNKKDTPCRTIYDTITGTAWNPDSGTVMKYK